MREDLLHFVWKANKLIGQQLFTTNNEPLLILAPGTHNHLEGPDFFNAKIAIDGQLWAGNIEMHLKGSDWFAHGHETDSNYDNVILHVVWDDVISVFRRDRTEIPTLKVKNYVSNELLDSYTKLLQNSKKKFINCETDFGAIDRFLIDNWLDRLYIERLEEKSTLIINLLKQYQNDWEKVLFCQLMKSFGSKINGEFFLALANAIDFSIIRKIHDKPLQLEALIMGMAGLLENDESTEAHYLKLKNEYNFLKSKFRLEPIKGTKIAFFGLRPNNFPTIRLSQVAQLYHKHQNLFSRILEAKILAELTGIFAISASSFWDSHYTFDKVSNSKRPKKLAPEFIELLVINTILPLKFCHVRYHGRENNEELIQLIRGLKSEKNRIVEKFDAIGPKTENALQSQSKIQLYTKYCSLNQCLHCAVGTRLLQGNT